LNSRLINQTTIGVSLSGARFLFGEFRSTLSFSAFIATGVILVLVLLRRVVRRTWAADALFVVLLSSALTPPSPVSIAAMVNGLGSVLFGAATLWIFRRFGLLALAAIGCANALMTGLPLAAASSGCAIVYSENLNPGQTIQGVRIENPLG
jgi:hypothetical protein